MCKTGSPIHTEDFRSSAAPPTVKDRFSNSHRRLSLQRCSTNCQGQVLQFTPKTFAPTLLHQLSRTGSPIHTEDFRSSAAPPIVKDKFSNSHRKLSFQRCSTNCQGHIFQFTPKTFVPALLHRLSRTCSPIHTENFRSSAALPTVKDRFSNLHRRLSLRTLWFQQCSTNCQGQDLQFTPKTFAAALLHQLSRTGPPIHTEDFRSSAAPPTVKDRTLQFTPKTFAPALLHQLSRTGSPIHTEDFRSSAAPPTVKDRFSNSHRRLSLQRCSTNCQGQVLQFTPKTFAPALLHQLSALDNRLQFTPKTFAPALLHQLSRTGSPIHTEDFRPSAVPPMSRTGSPIHTEDFRSSAAPPTVKDKFPNSHRRLPLQRCSTNCQGQVLQFTPKTFVPALLHQLSRTGSPIHTEDFRSNAAPPTVKDKFSNSHRRLSFQRCSTNCQGQVLQFTPKTFAPALLHQLSKTGSPIHTEDFRSSAAPPTVKDKFSNSHRRLSFQRCSTNCQGRDLQFTPKTFAPALLHQLSRTGSPIHTEDFRSSAAPPTVKDRDLQFTRKTFVPTLLHQLSRTGSPIHTEDFRPNAAPPTVKDRFSYSNRRLSFQRCSTNCQGQVLQFTPKTFVPALLHQLSRTGSPIHTEDFRSSAAPETVKDRFSNSTPKTFVPALLHQLSRTGSPIHTEDFRSSAAPPTVKDRFSNSHRRLSFQRCSINCAAPPTVKDRISNSHRRLSFQRCSTNCQGQAAPSPIHTEDFRSKAAPRTVKDRISNSNRRLWLQHCSTNCQGQVLLHTEDFVPALLHQLSRTGSPIHTKDFRSSAAPPTVKDMFSNSHRRLSLQRCSTNCQGQDLQFTPKTFAAALLHQLSRTGSPIHTEDFRSSAAPPTVKDRFSNSHRRLSLQRCSTNCQGQVLQFTPKTFRSSAAPPTVKDRISNSHRRLSLQRCSTNCQRQVLQFTPKTFVPANCQDQDLQFTPKTFVPAPVKDRISNSHRRLSFQRCSTNCQGQDLQFTPKTFVPALLHQLSRTGSPIHTENFRSSATPQLSTTGSPIHTEDFGSSAAPPTVKDRFSSSHRRLSLQRCSTNCQGQVLQFTPKTFAAALLHQLSRTRSPIHTEDFRSSAAPPTVKDKFSSSHRRLSLQRCSTDCPGQDLQITPKSFAAALLHQLSRTGSPIHTEDIRSNAAAPTVKDRVSNSHRGLSLQRCSTNCQGQVLQFTENFRSSAAPPTVKDRFSNSHRRLSLQRCSTNYQGQVLQFTPKTFAPTLLHELSRTGSLNHSENFRSNAAPPTVKDRFSRSHRRLSLQCCSTTNCQGQVLQFTPKTFVPALHHLLSRTNSPIHTEDFPFSAAPPTVKDRISNSHRRLWLKRCSTNCQGQVLQFTPKTSAPALLHQLSRTGLQFTPKTFVPALRHQLSKTGSPIHTEDLRSNAAQQLSKTSSPIHTENFRSSAAPPTSHRRLSLQRCSTNCQRQVLQFTPKTFAPALLHQLSRTGFPIHTEHYRSSAAPPTLMDGISNSHRRLAFQRCSTNCQGQVLRFTPKTFAPALLHQLSKTGSPIHTDVFRSSAAPQTVKDRFSNSQEDFRSSAAPPTVKDRFSNSHRKLSLQRCSTNCQGHVLQFTPKTFVPALRHQLSRAGSPIHTEDFRSSAAPPPVKDRFSNSHRSLPLQRCSTTCQGQVLQLTPKSSFQRCSTNCQR